MIYRAKRGEKATHSLIGKYSVRWDSWKQGDILVDLVYSAALGWLFQKRRNYSVLGAEFLMVRAISWNKRRSMLFYCEMPSS